MVYCSMMMFMGLAAVNTQANLLFGVFGLMIGVLIVAGMISRVVLRRLKVTRLLPEHAVVGKPITLMYEFTNTKRGVRHRSGSVKADGCMVTANPGPDVLGSPSFWYFCAPMAFKRLERVRA